ncbi:MAG: S-ribosylhomocysteine lyase [Solirubrobacterales bacterium]
MKIESFELDHRKVKAPYIRKAGLLKGKHGDSVTKFDLRLVQPNKGEIPTAAIHTLEHLLAGFLREGLEDIIDISPMGCRTGFYMTLWGDRNVEEIKPAFINALEKVIEADDIPALNNVQCGNFKDHSLFSAKEYANLVLGGFKNELYK